IEVIDDHARPDVIRFYVSDPFGNRIEFMENKN
ncbi:glyoxalase, partial [Bacillus anthracis]|nr:glyoxalase [Bacillus anthracis]